MQPSLSCLLMTLIFSCFTMGSAFARDSSSCGSPGQYVLDITSSGISRPVLVFTPVHHSSRMPLVIDLHGSNSNGAEQAALTRFSEIASKQGFVVANPSGAISFPSAPDKHFWNIPGVPLATSPTSAPGSAPTVAPDAADDVQFISDLIDALIAQHCVDAKRVYVTGMSGGARMTSLLACRLSTRIAAVAPVAGLRAGLPDKANPQQPDASCHPERPMPIITFHGTGDAVNPYQGGGTPYWQYSIQTALQRWADLDQCTRAPVEKSISPHVVRVHYANCAQRSEIVLYRIEAPGALGGGHSWPGSIMSAEYAASIPPEQIRQVTPSTEVDATALIWQFFKQHRLFN